MEMQIRQGRPVTVVIETDAQRRSWAVSLEPGPFLATDWRARPVFPKKAPVIAPGHRAPRTRPFTNSAVQPRRFRWSQWGWHGGGYPRGMMVA
ncbi:MAG: hypothetical protein CM15mP125_4440 [Gammaproteobacteria bacterium]|nr:MAG: hypothetical protein CM15mP125_4440 [Gammaproteobacteria bacterium]